MDQTLCLYVEEGEERDKIVVASREVTSVTVSEEWPHEIVSAWIKTIYDGELDRNISSKLQPKWEDFVKRITFQQKLRELDLESDGLFGDVKFLMQGDVAVPGHKVLLQCSEFFGNILGNGMSDLSKISEILLQDLDSDRFQILKYFLYGCDIDLLSKNVPPVLVIARPDECVPECENSVPEHVLK